MADTSRIVDRVAARFVKQLTDPIEAALQRGGQRLSGLEAALHRGEAAALRIVDHAVQDADLRVLATKRPMEERLLDVAEESANATRCSVRPTGSGRPASAAIDATVQAANEASVLAAQTMIGTDTVTVTADISRAINRTPLRIPKDMPSVAEMQQALQEAAQVARFDASTARMRSVDIASLRPTKPLHGDSELVVRYRQGLPVPPVVINADGVILDGHERAASAWAAGLDRIPAVVVSSEDTASYLEWLRWNN